MLIQSQIPSYMYKIQGDKANEPAGEQPAATSFADMLGEDSPAEMLRKITENGVQSLWQWQMEELRKKVAQQVMEEMGITPEKLAAMPPQQRMSVEEKIMQEVERRIRDRVAEGLRKKDESGLSVGDAGLNIQANIDALTLSSVIELTQGLPKNGS